MEERLLLRKGFDYDLWANRQWLDAIGLFGDDAIRAQDPAAAAAAMLEHIELVSDVALLKQS